MNALESFFNSKIVSVTVITVCALISISSIVEVMARQELIGILETKSISLTKEGLELNQNLLADVVKKQGDLLAIIKSIDEKNTEISRQISEIRKLSGRLRTLTLGGAIQPSETLANIATQYQILLKAISTEEKAEQSSYLVLTKSFFTLKFIQTSSSTFLVAVLAVLSGVIGSLVTTFRFEEYRIDFLKRIVLGITTGFISFLLIKGGRSLFLLEGTDTLPLMNPYSAALFSLIGGMFTEKFFKLIGDIFDGFIRRVTTEAGHPPADTRSEPSGNGNPE